MRILKASGMLMIGVVAVLLLLLSVLAVASSNLGGSTTNQSTTNGAAQSSTTVPGIPPKTVFGLEPGPINTTVAQLPPNVLIWESFTMGNYTHVDGIETEFQIPAASYGSTLHMAVFVNGVARYQESYGVEKPATANGTVIPSSIEAFSVHIDAGFTSGTVITVGVLCNAMVDAITFETGHAYEISATAIPSSSPSTASASLKPFEFSAWAVSFT
jgi:hypothetical protein